MNQKNHLTQGPVTKKLVSLTIPMVFGMLSMDWMFRSLGADGETLSLVKQYMRIWYMGAAFVVIPMVGNNAIRACGNTLFPSLIMIISMIVNVILDPLLIFGKRGHTYLIDCIKR